ncbi:malonate decarboxylase holo-ACP synthase [Pseudomonas guariconensis]|uniref:malonate decarboxylase holo-ACP synthase n=1 Tax=Pseudomonas guariconensis TaxID=1288410 RepID=UPI0018A979F9|nr:malonate decarboxylase holo-ACP synthase [Pseudomonas guariconensis]MBF8741402.1 malonate decarboxylase holo-ACP synthase [Pseudomonas guariconensis]MBF8749014.1 malonate decarboxylase holo-ACP synthase [Pseudomonas guariconensis]
MNAPRAHDLLWGLASTELPPEAPGWARAALVGGQPVVVRRALCDEGRVAVGVRGLARDQRLAWDMALSAVSRVLSPEAIRGERTDGLPALQALAELTPALDDSGLAWGPTGGVGYQLASGVCVLHAASDLDLLLRTHEPLAREQACALLARLERAPCRVDVQLQVPAGAVALREWASGARRVLLKSALGARLVSDPWQVQECAA